MQVTVATSHTLKIEFVLLADEKNTQVWSNRDATLVFNYFFIILNTVLRNELTWLRCTRAFI